MTTHPKPEALPGLWRERAIVASPLWKAAALAMADELEASLAAHRVVVDEWIAGYMQGANDHADRKLDQVELKHDAEMAQYHDPAAPGDGLVLVPVRLPPLAVSEIKDVIEEEYGMYSVKARPLWASLLKIVAGLSIEQQVAINEQRQNAAPARPQQGEGNGDG